MRKILVLLEVYSILKVKRQILSLVKLIFFIEDHDMCC